MLLIFSIMQSVQLTSGDIFSSLLLVYIVSLYCNVTRLQAPLQLSGHEESFYFWHFISFSIILEETKFFGLSSFCIKELISYIQINERNFNKMQFLFWTLLLWNVDVPPSIPEPSLQATPLLNCTIMRISVSVFLHVIKI